MLTIALTGGIATGKSYVLGRFQALGVPTLDADLLVHEAMRPGSDAALAIGRRFGPGTIQCDGAVDRQRLAALVFSDAAARKDLEDILHPEVYRAIRRWFEAFATQGHRMAMADIPLLYETGHEADFDRVIVMACDAEEQIARAVARGMTEADVRLRMAAQWPTADKAARADFVITTNGSFEETDRQIDVVYRALLDEINRR
jgi:dephospho-CoA kinase